MLSSLATKATVQQDMNIEASLSPVALHILRYKSYPASRHCRHGGTAVNSSYLHILALRLLLRRLQDLDQ
jgi:hypothetical protein